MFIFEREQESASMGEAGRVGDRILSRLHAVGPEVMNCEIMIGAEVGHLTD